MSLMKKVLVILILALTASTLSAQTRHRGIALGADRDTLKYIIASPFDNWYVNAGVGIQTFIGNEVTSSARHNKLNFNGQVELGKWIIPDVAISLRYSIFNVDGQSRYSRNPFIDFTGVPIDADGNLEYQSFHAYAMALLGFVTFDWTNFFNGYEVGKRTKLHWRTAIGLGMSMLFGNQKNPHDLEGYNAGDFRKNFELAFALNIGAEYALTERTALFSRIELFGSESTWDWSPYDNSHSIFDFIPSFNAGARFNILSSVTKYHADTKTSSRDTIYHEFLPTVSPRTIKTLHEKIDHLMAERDRLLDDIGRRNQRGIEDSLAIDSLNHELDLLQEKLHQYEDSLANYKANTLIDELLDINKVLELPQAVVYFKLDKYDLDYNARKRLQDFAKDIHGLSDTTEYYIIGAADSLTGSIKYNQRLSQRRCEAARKLLTDNFGVSTNQLIPVYAGGINDYDPQENNRMVLVIQRSPVTEEIVDRWLRLSRARLEQNKKR